MAEEEILSSRLECRGLRHSYRHIAILRDVSLALNRGETIALLGHSGSGKSTLLKCLCLLEPANGGDAFLDGQRYMHRGKPIFTPWQLRARVGMVFQEYNLFPNMTALRNITLALERVNSLPPTEAREIAGEVAQKLGIESLLSRYPDSLSGGQRQRLALARALALGPQVLLLDEVTAALDPVAVESMTGAIRRIRDVNRAHGLAIVLVTHILRFAIDFADKIAFLHDGMIVEQWPSELFVSRSTHFAAKAFIDAALCEGGNRSST